VVKKFSQHTAPAERSAGARAFPGLEPLTQAKLEEWKRDPDVVGVILVGSKTRGFHDELSDDDLEVLLEESAYARLAPTECIALGYEGEGDTKRLAYDAQLTSLADLVRKRTSPIDLDRWPYERAIVLYDPSGRVAEAVVAAGRMDPEFRATRLKHAMLDAAIAARRAEKTLRRGYEGAARMLLARSARALVRIAFALEHRWVPLDHWLERELETLPDPEHVGPAALEVMVTPKPEIVFAALERLQPQLAEAGVPGAEGRLQLFLELIHPSHAAERAIHAVQ